MIFLSPLVLAALAALALPVLIHLLSLPRVIEIRWAASRFLRRIVEKNRRRLRVEDLLLLLLRCLLLALLVLVFARPALLTDRAGAGSSDDTSTGAIVLDVSASMGQSDGLRTRFDQARAAADALIAHLDHGSSLALYLVSNRVRAAVPDPVSDRDILRQALRATTLTDGGSDLYPGIKSAMAMLIASPVRHRDIYVITDSQVAAWHQLSRIRELQAANQDRIVLHAVIIGTGGEDNLAVSALQASGTLAAVNQPLRCGVQIANWGRAAVGKIPVRLSVDDDAPVDQQIVSRLEPGATATVTFSVQFTLPGYHTITARLPPDRLAADNQRTLALFIHPQRHVLIVEGAAQADESHRDGFFLRHALVPVPRAQASRHYLKVALGLPADLESPSLAENQLIFLCNTESLTTAAAQNLRRYVEQGGALVVFPGPRTDPAYLNAQPDLRALLPARLAPARDATTPEKSLGWQSKDYPHPITALWNDPDSGDLGGVRAFRYFPLTLPPEAAAARVVVHYTDGEPALVEQPVGRGRVFLFSTAATPSWSTLPLHPAFVPLLIRLIAYLDGGVGSGLNLIAGQPFSFPVEEKLAGQTLYLQRPGQTGRQSLGPIETAASATRLHFGDTEIAGRYRMYVGDDPVPKAVFAVQIDPAESNLTQEPSDALASLLHPPPAVAPRAEAPRPGAPHARVPGRELWYPLALAALLFLFVETFLAQRLSR